MKEIKYDGDLEKDISYFKEKRQGFFKKYVLNFPMVLSIFTLFIVLLYVYPIYFEPIINGQLANILAFSSVGVLAVYHQFYNYRLGKKKKQAYKNLRGLAKKLKEEDISVGKRAFRDSVSLEKADVLAGEERGKEAYQDAEKICQYFCLLDREDQIRVLQWVRDYLSKEQGQVFLLEEKDLNGMNLPVRRVLQKNESRTK